MKKFLIIAIFLIIISYSSCYAAQIPRLEEINFDIHTNSDGTVDVEETWKIEKAISGIIKMNMQIKNINTDDISNIKVYRKLSDEIMDFEQGEFTEEDIKTGNYSVINSGDDYTILCGIGRFNDVVLSYRVNNVMTAYADCVDLQLEFLNDKLGIVPDYVTGNLYLPSKASKSDDLFMWKNVEDLHTEIKTKDYEKFPFTENNINKNGIKIRVLMPISKFRDIKSVSNTMMKDSIVSEESNIVFSSNFKSIAFNVALIVAEVIILIIMALKFFKYLKEFKEVSSGKSAPKFKYYKELPYAGITPGQAAFIKDIKDTKIGDVFSAALLSLKMKEVIDITYVGEEKKLESAFIKLINLNPNLEVEEKPIFEFLTSYIEEFQRKDLTISLNMLQKYMAHSTEKVSKLKLNILNAIKESLTFYDSNVEKIVKRRKIIIFLNAIVLIAMIAIQGLGISLYSLSTWVKALAVINSLLCIGIITQIKLFNVEGEIYRERLKGLQNYMLNLSACNEKDIPDISVWEYYMIFAVSFGISRKVFEQINISYEDIENTGFMEGYGIVENIVKCNFRKSFLISTSEK